MPNNQHELIKKILREEYNIASSDYEDMILKLLAKKVSVNVDEEAEDQRTFGERLADKLALYAGSWMFIIVFSAFIVIWMMINTILLTQSNAFDPYPFILLNLILSTIAALQAPVIMMSQNRQAAKDRLQAEGDYTVNLKSEIIIQDLYMQIDELRDDNDKMMLELLEMKRILKQILKKEEDKKGCDRS